MPALRIVTLVVFIVQCAPVPGSATTCEGIRVLCDELRPAEVEAYCRYALQERQKVEAFWGATWSEPIWIHVIGKDLRQLAVCGLSGVESLESLNSVRTPRPLGTVMEEKTASILAGSFVGFLIEREGLALFRSVYETGNYEKVYGKPLRTLEEAWRVSLREQ